MTPRVFKVRHWRIGVGFQVAICGAREVSFAAKPTWITCPACAAKHADPARRAQIRSRNKAQIAARRKYLALAMPWA